MDAIFRFTNVTSYNYVTAPISLFPIRNGIYSVYLKRPVTLIGKTFDDEEVLFVIYLVYYHKIYV